MLSICFVYFVVILFFSLLSFFSVYFIICDFSLTLDFELLGFNSNILLYRLYLIGSLYYLWDLLFLFLQ